VLLMGARYAFAGRHMIVGPDGLAYLDVARAYLRHDWHTAVNGYWGPIYSWLLAIGMAIFHPGIRAEFPMIRALNFVLFAAALYAFGRFWRAVADWSRCRSVGAQTLLPEASVLVWIVLGHLLFIAHFAWCVYIVTPDILVAIIIFVVSAFVFKLNDHQQHGIRSYAWLGLLLAVGFYAKAILLYFALFIMGAIVIQGFRSGSLRRPITTIIVFVALVSPFVVAVSRTLGHFSVGDSGRLSYAWLVDGPETKTWLKEGGAPMPFYPGPIDSESPRVFHVPSIRGVTYAPWYDAARFDNRSHPTFNLHLQLRHLATALKSLREQMSGAEIALFVPMLIVVWYAPKASLRRCMASWFCTLPVLGVIGMYLLVYLVPRYLIGFSLILWGSALASICVCPGTQLLARRAFLAGILVFAWCVMPGLLHYLVADHTESSERDIAIAEAISQYGITPGDAVASIGNGQQAYWAHLARVSIVAEVWSIDSPRFWSESAVIRQAALRSMAYAGAKAVFWRRDSDQSCPPQWSSLPENSGCMISLR
jgi:hypothetical protein